MHNLRGLYPALYAGNPPLIKISRASLFTNLCSLAKHLVQSRLDRGRLGSKMDHAHASFIQDCDQSARQRQPIHVSILGAEVQSELLSWQGEVH